MNGFIKKISIKEILTVLMLLFATYITARLAPLSQDIAVIKAEVQANDSIDAKEHPNFVTKDEFNQVVTRLDYISGRVDLIVGKLIK